MTHASACWSAWITSRLWLNSAGSAGDTDVFFRAGRAVTSTIYLAHGASGSAASMRPHVRGLETRGLRAVAVQLQRGGPAERAVPRYREQVRGKPGEAVIGGHSFGGRVASLLASEDEVAGLVLLSFPLHRPGRPETAETRTAHFGAIRCPVLLLSGESDAFARLEPLRDVVKRLPNAELVTYPGVGHGLKPVLDDALDRIAAFVRDL
jgi:predicted alpha/beta-hydrolase family hydrolase